MGTDIIILGIFVADTSFRATRLPKMGETLMGSGFHLGPGGKGSNQAVAAAKAGARTGFITKLGKDDFAEMALSMWRDAGLVPMVSQHEDSFTGAAFVFIEEASGNNAIIVSPGVAETISPEDVKAHSAQIAKAKIFMTQLEQPLDAAFYGLELARSHHLTTILNPAPAAQLPDEMLALCDYITPNETEAEALTGIAVPDEAGAKKAAIELCRRGVGTAIITLSDRGAYIHNEGISTVIDVFKAGPVVETTGAGDAFNGGFAAGLVKGMDLLQAARYASATAGLCVTRAGTASAMPDEDEITALIAKTA